MSRSARHAAFVIHSPLCDIICATQPAQLAHGETLPFLSYLRNEMITCDRNNV